ncbi:hypothetical protein PtB15_10B217 [Puccinia triticina]|nr:hypothetical protein PtB15_10B217 [Puccinia triticina]
MFGSPRNKSLVTSHQGVLDFELGNIQGQSLPAADADAHRKITSILRGSSLAMTPHDARCTHAQGYRRPARAYMR